MPLHLRLFVLIFFLGGCRQLDRFSTPNDHYEGQVVASQFVRAGFASDLRLCMTFDAARLQQSPGTLSLSDGSLKNTPLRPIPEVWHDTLSTLSFGEGRVRNLLYSATMQVGAGQAELLVVVSLLESGDAEVRFLAGAPALGLNDAGASQPHYFGIFNLTRREGACSF